MPQSSHHSTSNRMLISLQIFFVLTIAVIFLAIVVPVSALAQNAGISIKPATIEETLDPGTEKKYSIKIENLSSAEQTFYLFTRNISGVRDGGVPIFATDSQVCTGFELADWVTIPFDQITLPGNGFKNVELSIAVPDDGAPGSHFGGMFISVDPPEIESSGAAVGYQVANIISIRVSGDVVEEASIRQFSTSKFLYGSQDVDFSVRIENSGNVLVKPIGPLEIYNMLGNKVDTIIFNEKQDAVFPTSSCADANMVNNVREYSDIIWTGDSSGFGRYEAILSPVYGDFGAKKTMSSTVTFWILPMNIIGPALGVLAVLLLIVYIFVRMYIKRSLAHLSVGRRVVRRRRKNDSSATLLITVVTLTVIALFLIVLLALFA